MIHYYVMLDALSVRVLRFAATDPVRSWSFKVQTYTQLGTACPVGVVVNVITTAYHDLVNTLIHELVHNWHGPHDEQY